ncbi:MAG: nucleoside permease [Bacteroidota bacterium]
MTTSIRIRLSIMMFLEFFIWGLWYVTMGTFIGEQLSGDGIQTGLAYQTTAIGAMIAPFFIGLVADRFFPAQRIMGILHLAGAALLYFAAGSEDFRGFYGFILIYGILYMPTLALVNSISFRQMADPEKDFAGIRVLGTIGWIVAGLLIGWLGWESNNSLQNTFYFAAGASAILGVYSFLLPHTPPLVEAGQKVTVRDILGLDALSLLKDRSYLVFFLASILLCIPLSFYYNFANFYFNEIGVENAAGKMTIGQMSEILFLLLLPWFFQRLGVKKTLLIGMLAWALRYLLFALGDAGSGAWMLIMGIALHGICYDFFFVTGQIYTDKLAGEKVKNAAQGLIAFATYGVGMFIGAIASGYLVELYATSENAHDWFTIWSWPAGFAGAILVLFALVFKDKPST